PRGFDGDIEEMDSRRGLNKQDTYNAFGSESRAAAEELLSDGTTYPDWVTSRYLQLPKDLPQRVTDEATRIIREQRAQTPYEKAFVVEQYLRDLPYDLAVPSPPPGRDAADYLLFELKRGYFDY